VQQPGDAIILINDANEQKFEPVNQREQSF